MESPDATAARFVRLSYWPSTSAVRWAAETVARQGPRRWIVKTGANGAGKGVGEGFRASKSSSTLKVWFKAISASAVTACVPCEVR